MRIALSLLTALIWINAASAQSTVVKGTITQSNGKPIQSASVHLLNTNLFTITDKDGQFKLTNVLPGRYIVEVSAVSFSSYTKEISVNETQLDVSIILNESYKQLG